MVHLNVMLVDILKKNLNYKLVSQKELRALDYALKMERQDTISDEKLDKYFDVTGRALNKLTFASPKKTHLDIIAKDYLLMAQTYYDDAKHFKSQGDYINAFAALNYAHGWLDAGARIGIFDVEHDSVLFTVD